MKDVPKACSMSPCEANWPCQLLMQSPRALKSPLCLFPRRETADVILMARIMSQVIALWENLCKVLHRGPIFLNELWTLMLWWKGFLNKLVDFCSVRTPGPPWCFSFPCNWNICSSSVIFAVQNIHIHCFHFCPLPSSTRLDRYSGRRRQGLRLLLTRSGRCVLWLSKLSFTQGEI